MTETWWVLILTGLSIIVLDVLLNPRWISMGQFIIGLGLLMLIMTPERPERRWSIDG